MMNEAPIYINPDQMFGYTKHLFLCAECNKWVFGMTKDPFDEGSYVSDEGATCPHEANWSGLKVTCLDDEEKPEPEHCQLEASEGQCIEIGDQCNMKATEYSDGTNEGSKATVYCR